MSSRASATAAASAARNGFHCINLQIDTTLGEPGATRCMAYDVRFDGMPIIGRNAQGEVRHGVCRKDTPRRPKSSCSSSEKAVR
jgi:hypothetical protein